MTNISSVQTVVEQYQETDQGRSEFAAAKAELRVASLLRKAFVASGLTARALAAKLKVSEGRVSQVLNSNGNLRVTTIARFLRQMGYELVLQAKPVGHHTHLPQRQSKRGMKYALNVYSSEDSHSTAKPVLVFSEEDGVNNFGPISVKKLGSIYINAGSSTKHSSQQINAQNMISEKLKISYELTSGVEHEA